MKLINTITKDPKQTTTVILDDGSRVVLTLVYKQNQQGWFYSISYGTLFNVNNRRVTASPNMLRAFRNILSFGLVCITNDGYEPVFIDDFSGGRAKMFVLEQADMDQVEVAISG